MVDVHMSELPTHLSESAEKKLIDFVESTNIKVEPDIVSSEIHSDLAYFAKTIYEKESPARYALRRMTEARHAAKSSVARPHSISKQVSLLSKAKQISLLRDANALQTGVALGRGTSTAMVSRHVLSSNRKNLLVVKAHHTSRPRMGNGARRAENNDINMSESFDQPEGNDHQVLTEQTDKHCEKNVNEIETLDTEAEAILENLLRENISDYIESTKDTINRSLLPITGEGFNLKRSGYEENPSNCNPTKKLNTEFVKPNLENEPVITLTKEEENSERKNIFEMLNEAEIDFESGENGLEKVENNVTGKTVKEPSKLPIMEETVAADDLDDQSSTIKFQITKEKLSFIIMERLKTLISDQVKSELRQIRVHASELMSALKTERRTNQNLLQKLISVTKAYDKAFRFKKSNAKKRVLEKKRLSTTTHANAIVGRTRSQVKPTQVKKQSLLKPKPINQNFVILAAPKNPEMTNISTSPSLQNVIHLKPVTAENKDSFTFKQKADPHELNTLAIAPSSSNCLASRSKNNYTRKPNVLKSTTIQTSSTSEAMPNLLTKIPIQTPQSTNHEPDVPSPVMSIFPAKVQKTDVKLPGSVLPNVKSNLSAMVIIQEPLNNLNISAESLPIISDMPEEAQKVDVTSRFSHPAKLPNLSFSSPSEAKKRLLPPKPGLKTSHMSNEIRLMWSMDLTPKHADMKKYLMYAYQEVDSKPSPRKWKKVGEIDALPPPMACTMSRFSEGYNYYFAVCAVDVYDRIGQFSDPQLVRYFQDNTSRNSDSESCASEETSTSPTAFVPTATTSRHVVMNDDDINAISRRNQNLADNTKQQTQWAVNLLRDFLQSRGADLSFEAMEAEELALWLRQFYCCVRQRQKDGSSDKEYSRSAYRNMRSGLQRHLVNAPFCRNIDLRNDKEFHKANQVYDGMLKRQTKESMVRKKPISDVDMIKIYESGVLSLDNPISLQRKVFLDISLHFGRRGRESWRSLNKSSFVKKVDENTREYITLSDHETNVNLRMFANPGYRFCPVKSFQLYISKLNRQFECFLQKPNSEYHGKAVWYAKAPLGVHTIGSMMRDICVTAGTSQIYTNHCLTIGAVSDNVRLQDGDKSFPAISSDMEEP